MRFYICVLGFLFSFALNAFAQGCELIKSEGLRGEEFVTLAVHPKKRDLVFLGTTGGLYRGNVGGKVLWDPVRDLPQGSCRINRIYFTVLGDVAYVATEKGLYVFQSDAGKWHSVFAKSDELSNDCLSVLESVNGTLFVGTRAGLYSKKRSENEWSKTGSPFGDEAISFLFGAGDVVYAATKTCVYKSERDGRDWEKVLNMYSYAEEADDSASEENGLVDFYPSVKYVTGITGNSSLLYVATTQGIFVTEDAGKSFSRLPSSGLDSASLRALSIGSDALRILVALKTGVYEFDKGKGVWQPKAVIADCIEIARKMDDFVVLTPRDIYLCVDNGSEADPGTDRLASAFDHEPTIQEVQKMAIRYAEVGNEKITEWRRRAAVRAILPTLSGGYGNNVYGSSKGEFAVGPSDWDVNVSWDLADLIYSDAQTSIDTRSKLMVQLRNDILSEVTKLYFERRRLQLKLLDKKAMGRSDGVDEEMRLMELTALLDRLTGGGFSKAL